MNQVNHDFKIGDKLYYSDEPTILAGIVTGFTPKRDIIIDFVSGRKLGEQSYPIKLAKGFIRKD